MEILDPDRLLAGAASGPQAAYEAPRIAMRGSPSTWYPARIHASSPPASGRTSRNPLSISMRATRAAVASLGQVQ